MSTIIFHPAAETENFVRGGYAQNHGEVRVAPLDVVRADGERSQKFPMVYTVASLAVFCGAFWLGVAAIVLH